jgi:hypothetical protein
MDAYSLGRALKPSTRCAHLMLAKVVPLRLIEADASRTQMMLQERAHIRRCDSIKTMSGAQLRSLTEFVR